MSISRGYRTELHAPHRSSFLGHGQSAPALQGITSRSHEATLDWFAAAERVGHLADLDASAHSHGAMLRRRGVPSATNLLCLAFLYGPGRMPLRLIAERADLLGIAHVSEPALLRRLLNAGDWLDHLADELILQHLDQLAALNDNPTPYSARMSTAAPMMMMNNFNTPTLRDERAMQADMAKRFILDFVPWPTDLYTDAQVHWLLCARWTFVASTIKDGPLSRIETDSQPASSLERTRLLAHLIASVISREDLTAA